MTKLMYATIQSNEADLPRIVARTMAAYGAAFRKKDLAQKAWDFQKRIYGTGTTEAGEAERLAIRVAALNAESEMWAAYDEMTEAIKKFNADPDGAWALQQAADEDAAADAALYAVECAELRGGL